MTGHSPYDMSNPDLGVGTDTGDGDSLGKVSQTQEYTMISWLVEQIFNDPTNKNGDWGAYGGAIWSIADGGWKVSDYENKVFGGGLTEEAAVADAFAHKDDAHLPKYNIYTPSPLKAGQEFFSPAAEPSTVLLLSLVLLAGLFFSSPLGSLWRKRPASR